MIVSTQARIITKEHLHRPLGPRVLELGVQEIRMSSSDIISLIEWEGYNIAPDVKKSVIAKGIITDVGFFSLLGVKHVSAMDINPDGGADIIHDLNKPVSESLHGQFDFIVDGGTFDHILDIKTAFENVVRMLKSNGRVFHWNAASNYVGYAYLCLEPDLFLDYYLVNHFADCQAYIAEGPHPSHQGPWEIYKFEGIHPLPFKSSQYVMTLILAEKGPDSTFGAMPVQDQYRSQELSRQYESTYRRFAEVDRKPWTGLAGMGRDVPTFRYMGLI